MKPMTSSDEHKAFCGHVLFQPLMRAAKTGKFCDLLSRLSSDVAAQDAMTSAAIVTPQPRKRVVRPDETLSTECWKVGRRTVGAKMVAER